MGRLLLPSLYSCYVILPSGALTLHQRTAAGAACPDLPHATCTASCANRKNTGNSISHMCVGEEDGEDIFLDTPPFGADPQGEIARYSGSSAGVVKPGYKDDNGWYSDEQYCQYARFSAGRCRASFEA